ncbi:HflB protease [Candidatus Phytoplasma pruni]|uniref:HflB protease n=1 Tax=Candidatus Phytoplasma pruni TaxID=479893 RepID=A0A0M1MZU0_9MOLU|nr:hypothetical protein [Candidatus Phytoplasma pruni]KOR75411.1 HflB protease [Candidatus Phytoplasma pruni]MCQ9618548.1 hypothetical protein [Candidatus Phytoplasma pruni]
MNSTQLGDILNETSILTVRNDKETITNEKLYEAIDLVLMVPTKKSRKYDEEEKKMVAYHEAEHTVSHWFKIKTCSKSAQSNYYS